MMTLREPRIVMTFLNDLSLFIASPEGKIGLQLAQLLSAPARGFAGPCLVPKCQIQVPVAVTDATNKHSRALPRGRWDREDRQGPTLEVCEKREETTMEQFSKPALYPNLLQLQSHHQIPLHCTTPTTILHLHFHHTLGRRTHRNTLLNHLSHRRART